MALNELPGMIAGNVYQTPMPGRDSGHPGIDLAFYSHGSHKTMLGLPLKAAMAGRIAAVLPDRYPYGNALIIEVPLEKVPPRWLANLNWPAVEATVVPDGRLTCPAPLNLPQMEPQRAFVVPDVRSPQPAFILEGGRSGQLRADYRRSRHDWCIG